MATAVFGCGYWGSKIIQILKTDLAVICDTRQEVLDDLGEEFDHIPKVTRVDRVWEMSAVKRVVVVTPPDTHFNLAKEALTRGLDVFVEKPMTTTSADGLALCKIATNLKRVLMVGHVTNYHIEAEMFCDWIKDGRFGRLRKIQTQRLGCAFLRPDLDVMWNCGLHDVALSLRFMREGGFILDESSMKVMHSKCRGVQADTVFMSATFLDDNREEAILEIHAGCHYGRRQRSLQIVFDHALVSWDATKPCGDQDSLKISYYHQLEGDKITIRDADRKMSALSDSTMPLNRELSHFLDCCLDRATPLTDGADGVRVIKFLELVSRYKTEDKRAPSIA